MDLDNARISIVSELTSTSLSIISLTSNAGGSIGGKSENSESVQRRESNSSKVSIKLNQKLVSKLMMKFKNCLCIPCPWDL